MAKEISFPLEKKPLLDDLMELQTDIIQAREHGDEVLARLHEIDFNMALDKLRINPCSICYYGSDGSPTKCHLWSRCQSMIKVERVWASEAAAYLSLSLIFQVS